MSIPDVSLDVWILLHQKTHKGLSSSSEAQKKSHFTSPNYHLYVSNSLSHCIPMHIRPFGQCIDYSIGQLLQ